QDGQPRSDLHQEIAPRGRIERVSHRPGEAELSGHAFAIEREARSCYRASTQRRFIRPSSRISEALKVSFEHGVPGHQVVGKAARLSALKMRVRRHEHLDLLRCAVEEDLTERL